MKRGAVSRGALGRAIAVARAETGLSQEALGRRTGLGQTAISRIETGQRRLDSVELVEIAEQLGVEAGDLLARAREANHGRDGDEDTPTGPYDGAARLVSRSDPVTAQALAWVPGFLARLEELERLPLDG